MEKLSNKIVLITGASSGIGQACAEVFAGEGASLILAARRKGRLEKLAENLAQKYSVKVHCLVFDIRNKTEVDNAISSLPDDLKDIDILINNAGLARGLSKVYEADVDNWEEMIDTNIKGLLYVTRQVLPQMAGREDGHIINIGSTAGHETYINGNVYSATKFAVKALTQSIRLDVLDKNIKVSSVDPGMVETEFSTVRFSGDEDRAKQVYNGLIPLKAKDVAEAVLFCATRPSYVNINEIIITPLAQASSSQVYRKEKSG